MNKYTRPPFDSRLVGIVNLNTDATFAKKLIEVLQDCHKEIVRFTEKTNNTLFDQVKDASATNYAASVLVMPDRAIDVNKLRKDSENTLSSQIIETKARAREKIDSYVVSRCGAIAGAKMSQQHHYTSIKNSEAYLISQVKTNQNITAEELQARWFSKSWVSYEYLNTLREVAKERCIDWQPKHFLDDTAELTMAVGMYAKKYIDQIQMNSDIDTAISDIKQAATTGYDAEGKLLIKLKDDGMPALFDYVAG